MSDIRIGYGQGTVPLIFPLDGDNMCVKDFINLLLIGFKSDFSVLLT